MKPVEIIYNGYIAEHEGIDTEETSEAADALIGMIESLLPNSTKIQDALFMECLQLARDIVPKLCVPLLILHTKNLA